MFVDFLIAQQVNQTYGNALEVLVSDFPVPYMKFGEPCFSNRDLGGLQGFIGFKALGYVGRILPCSEMWE